MPKKYNLSHFLNN